MRWGNLALLVLVPAAGLTGLACFLVGTAGLSPVVVAHGILGVAIVAVVPWKQVAVRRGLRRRPADVATSVLLGVAVVVALSSGFAHSTGVLRTTPLLSAMQVHVGAAVVAALPFAWHVVHRPQRPRPADLSRRTVLLGTALLAGAGGAYAALGGFARLVGLPGAERRGTGSFERAAAPATIWLFDEVPAADPDTWTVAVTTGGRTRRLDRAALGTGADQVTAVLDCTSGWWARSSWTGVRVARLLPADATGSVLVRSATGYTRRLPVGDDLLLATACDGRPLDAGHGAPVRLVVPGRRGYHWVKWVVAVEHDPDRPWWQQSPLPLQ